jgi:hypothetical protein
LKLPDGVSMVMHGKADMVIATVVTQGAEEPEPEAAPAPAPVAKAPAPAPRKEEKKGDRR